MIRYLVFAIGMVAYGAPQVYTVCASGCDFTSVGTAATAAKTYQDGTSCVPVVVNIRAGETFTEAIYLPAKSCAQYVYLRSDRLGELAVNRRVTPSDAAKMPKIISGPGDTDPTISTVEASGTGYWAFEGLEVTMPDLGVAIKYSVMQLGWPTVNENTVEKTPHHIIVDRSYIHGIADKEGPVRCVSMNSRNAIVSNSYLAECKSANTDSQAISTNQALGPLVVRNNYLEGAGENFISGGGDGLGNSLIHIPGVSQRDFRFLGNHFKKKPQWRVTTASGTPTRDCMVGEYQQDTGTAQWYQCTSAPNTWGSIAYTPPTFIVKNLFELKDGTGVIVFGNTLEKSWEAGQNGYAFLLNQSGNYTNNYNIKSPLYQGNMIYDANAGVSFGNLNYTISPNGTTRTHGATILNNVFARTAAPYLHTNGATARFLMTHRTFDTVFRHNTSYNYPGAGSYNIIGSNDDTFPSLGGYNFIGDNVFDSDYTGNTYLWDSGGQTYCYLYNVITGFDGSTLLSTSAFVGSGTTGSVCTGGSGSRWPTDIVTYAAITDVLTDPANDDFTINPSATGAIGTATDGTNMGVDTNFVTWATTGSTTGVDNPFLDFQVRGVTVTDTGATLYATAPSTTTCSGIVSTSQSLSPTTGSVSITQTGRSIDETVSSLSANTFYYYQITCGSQNITGSFRTAQ